MEKFVRTKSEQEQAKEVKKMFKVEGWAIDLMLQHNRQNQVTLNRIKADHPNWYNKDGTMKSQEVIREIIVLESDPRRLNNEDLALRKKLLAKKKKSASRLPS